LDRLRERRDRYLAPAAAPEEAKEGLAMTSKHFLMTCFAGILSFPGTTFAQTQPPNLGATPTPPKAITLDAHRIATNGGTIKSGMGSTLGVKPGANFTSIGWHYFHATYCNVIFDGVNSWVYVYPQEGGFWFTSINYFVNAFLNQCVLGNFVAVYVYDTAGDYSQVYTYTYK
jgi:hypothetical protein